MEVYRQECRVIEESSAIRIEVDLITIADHSHSFLTGAGRISRKKQHFEGLLKAIRDQNAVVYEQSVEKRDLTKYEDVI